MSCVERIKWKIECYCYSLKDQFRLKCILQNKSFSEFINVACYPVLRKCYGFPFRSLFCDFNNNCFVHLLCFSKLHRPKKVSSNLVKLSVLERAI